MAGLACWTSKTGSSWIATVRFLCACANDSIVLQNCPPYVRAWMAREGDLHDHRTERIVTKSILSRPHVVARSATFSALLGYFVMAGCSSPRASAPTVAFSKVPAAHQESPYKADISERDYKTGTIEGRVKGAQREQRLVVYAHT